MRSCRAKHNGFVLWEPKGALCLLTVNPQNGAGQVGGGTIRAKLDGHRSAIAKGGQGAREELGSFHSPLPCCVSTQGRVGCGSSDGGGGKGVVLMLLQVKKIENGVWEAEGLRTQVFAVRQTRVPG